jgi:hypothetical protein
VNVEDGRRTSHIEELANEWVLGLKATLSNYKFTLLRTIYTLSDEAIKQHFVVVQLEYVYKGL